MHLPTLQRLAKKHGLELLYAANFTDFFANEWHKHTDLLERMKVLPHEGSLSQEEWDVAHCYMAVAFKRVARAAEGEAAAPAQPVRNPGHRKLKPAVDIIYLSQAEADAAAATDAAAAEEEASAGGKRAADGSGPTGASPRGGKRPRGAKVEEEAEPPPFGEVLGAEVRSQVKYEADGKDDALFD